MPAQTHNFMFKPGEQNRIVNVFCADVGATSAAAYGLAGLAYTHIVKCGYKRGGHRGAQGDSADTAITPATAVLGTYTSGGFVEVDATNFMGWYEFGIPNACLAEGADFVDIYLSFGDVASMPDDIVIHIDLIRSIAR